jgi:lincosamide nucleotidyltransferase A/C/D/E
MRAGRGRDPQLDMSAADAVAILDRVEGKGLTVWVDGGWAIDAVAGRQTRPHDDLDLVARLAEVPALEQELAALGYERAGGEPPWSFESVDAAGRQVDVHPIAEDGAYQLRDGGVWHYPLAGLEGRGTIGGRAVRCLDVETQLVCHRGYEPLDLDRHRHDMTLLESLRP